MPSRGLIEKDYRLQEAGLLPFANRVRRYLPRVGSMTMFPQVYSLPGPQGEPATGDRDRKDGRGQGVAHVRRHIILPFLGVHEKTVAVRNQPGEEAFQIAPHVRVGIFLNKKRGGSV